MKVAVFLPNVHSTCASDNEKTGGKRLSDLSLSLFLVFLVPVSQYNFSSFIHRESGITPGVESSFGLVL